MRLIHPSPTVWILIGIIALSLLVLSMTLIYSHQITPQTTPPTLLPATPTLGPPVSTVILTPTPTHAPTPKPTPSIKYTQVFVTFYGWPDNSPAGNGIAYPNSRYPETIHDNAGGVGSYADPITFAASENYLPIGTRIYLPYIQKYAIKEDLCGNCGDNHVDLWMESTAAFPTQLEQCFGQFTRQSISIEIDPPPGRPVNPTPFFNSTNGVCSQ